MLDANAADVEAEEYNGEHNEIFGVQLNYRKLPDPESIEAFDTESLLHQIEEIKLVKQNSNSRRGELLLTQQRELQKAKDRYDSNFAELTAQIAEIRKRLPGLNEDISALEEQAEDLDRIFQSKKAEWLESIRTRLSENERQEAETISLIDSIKYNRKDGKDKLDTSFDKLDTEIARKATSDVARISENKSAIQKKADQKKAQIEVDRTKALRENGINPEQLTSAEADATDLKASIDRIKKFEGSVSDYQNDNKYIFSKIPEWKSSLGEAKNRFS